ncbi:hypothetical protein J2Y58_002920 [Sphingomonas sp. BE138]|nr:hypothetical protein [Sphingomonas sp. BE138]MDR6789547.1 hypothetical protein [Sphingomonas sp. BE138]
MNDSNFTAALIFAAWAAWSLANISARAGRIATAIEALRDMAERNRR